MSDNQGQGPVRLSLVSSINNRNAASSQDAKMTNCFAVPVTQHDIAAVKRPGLQLALQGAAGCAQGVYNFLNNIYSVSSDVLNIFNSVSTTFIQTTASAGWSARSGMFGVGFNGKLWAMGGVNSGTYFQDTWSSSDGITWNFAQNAPWSTRAYAQCIVFNNLMWVMGGIGPGNTYLSDVWSTPDGVTWTQQNASAWTGRANFGLTILGTQMFIAGGQSSGALDVPGTYLNDVWSSSNGITWTQKRANANWAARSRFGFAGFNSLLVLLGGEIGGLPGAGGDLWTSPDGVTWTRVSANPFGQAGTGLYSKIFLTSSGSNYGIAPVVTLSGGGGSGATAFCALDGMDEDGTDDSGTVVAASISPSGSSYTSAPTVAFALGGGIPATGYAFLNANGVAGDKRGMAVIAGSTLYFFTFLNNGLPSNEIWQSANGTTWTLFQASPAYGARDAFAFYFGNLWVLSGVTATPTYQTDVWKGAFINGLSQTLAPTITCLPMSFNQTAQSLTHPLMFFKSNKDAYTYNADLNILFKINNANYPATTVPGIVYLDTFFFVMDPQGRIWNSAQNDPTTWTALGTIPLQNEPNGGVALGKVGPYLVALGQWSTSFFYDAAVAAPASPLALNIVLNSLIGCASGDSVTQIAGGMIWIGQTVSEGRGIYQIQNYIPVRISTPFIDTILEGSTLATVRAFATASRGHTFYIVSLIDVGVTLCYDLMTQIWVQWTSLSQNPQTIVTSLSMDAYGLTTGISTNHGLADGDPVVISGASVGGYNGTWNVNVVDVNTFTFITVPGLAPSVGSSNAASYAYSFYVGYSAASNGNTYYIQHYNNGGIYQSSDDLFSDFGNPIDVHIKTQIWGGGTVKYKTFPDVSLIGDVVSSTGMLRYTNDDYNTYSSYRFINLAIIRQHLTRCGRARRRAWEFRHTGFTELRVVYLEFVPEIGEF